MTLFYHLIISNTIAKFDPRHLTPPAKNEHLIHGIAFSQAPGINTRDTYAEERTAIYLILKI